MKGQFFRSLLGFLFFGSLLVLSTTAQEPPTMLDRESDLPDSRTISSTRASSGITSVAGSTVNYVSPGTIPYSIDFDLCFNVSVLSTDLEFMDRFDVDLPDYWSVLSVYPVAQSATSYEYCSSVATIAGVETGNVVYWQRDSTANPDICGPWSEGTYDFCARMRVPYCDSDPWSLPWSITGDGYGTEPHYVTGTTAPLECALGGLHLSGSDYALSCQGVTNLFVLNLENQTGADGTFSLQYGVSTGNGTISGPDEIYLGAGVDQDFQVELTSQPCLRSGEQVEAIVYAEGNGFAGFGYLTLDIIDEEYCVKCESTYLPCVLKED